MTKAQALALMTALEARTINASAVMSFDPAGAETWSVQLDPKAVYTGAQIGALANYCATNALTLSAQFSALGVV